jgi:phage-related tail fiber protein
VTIDGVLTSTSRVLVKNQTDPIENGVYLTGAGAWTRETDFDDPAEITGAFVPVV